MGNKAENKPNDCTGFDDPSPMKAGSVVVRTGTSESLAVCRAGNEKTSVYSAHPGSLMFLG